MSRSIYGTDEPALASRSIAAGRLSFAFTDGTVRDVRVDGVEVLRGIAFLVRDANWGTASASTTEVAVTERDGRATVSWRAAVPGLAWTGQIVADEGGLTFTAEGDASAELAVNRVGLVVLHPQDGFIGRDVRVEHTDGGAETVTIPHAVAPHQPATDIAALSYAPVPGLSVRIELHGDAFEMEDHRNWTDAGFKTYVRPLSRPRPFTLLAGTRILQSVRLTVMGVAAPVAAPERQTRGDLPEIALTVNPADLESVAPALEALRPQWLHLRLDHAPDDAIRRVATRGPRLLIDWPDGDATRLRDIGAELVTTGARQNFTELNRARPPADAVVLSHATSAIVHAADDRSVIETLEALPHVFASARALAPRAAYRPGPCTIGLAGGIANPDGRRLPAARLDPRHRAMFAAGWAVGVLAAAAAGGVASISFGTPAGDFGLLTDAGALTPLGHVVRAVADVAGRPVSVGRDRIEGDGFWLRANLGPAPATLDSGEALGPHGWAAAATLGPYGVARSAPWLQ